jgi:hypothetical protein
VRLTERDVAVLRDLVRFGVLAAPQLKRRHWPRARNLFTTWQRLRELRRAGYVDRYVLGFGQEAAYLPTGRGVTLSGLALPTPRCRPEFLTAVWHHLTVADVAFALLERFPGAAWTTERELRRARRTAAADAFGPTPEGETVGATGAARGKVPDGVLTLRGRRMAVEVELTQKSALAYAQIVATYVRRCEAGEYERVQWFALGDGTQRQVERAIARLAAGTPLHVAPMPDGVTVYGRARVAGRPGPDAAP